MCNTHGCENPVSAENVSGMCRQHAVLSGATCPEVGCGKPLSNRNTTGKCRDHSRRPYQPRPTRPTLLEVECASPGCEDVAKALCLCSVHYSAAYYLANRDKAIAYVAAYRAANPEKVVGWNRNRDRELVRSLNSDRKALKRDVFVERVYRKKVWQRDNGLCHLCLTLANENDWHLDHVVPLARGGTHEYLNVAVSHPSCNMRKHDKIESAEPARLEAALEASRTFHETRGTTTG